jgi:hypothetical protein
MTVPVLFLAIVELAENDSVSPFGRDSEKLPSPVATPNFLSSPRHRHWLPVRLGCAGSSFLFGRTVTALGAAFGADNALLKYGTSVSAGLLQTCISPVWRQASFRRDAISRLHA